MLYRRKYLFGINFSVGETSEVYIVMIPDYFCMGKQTNFSVVKADSDAEHIIPHVCYNVAQITQGDLCEQQLVAVISPEASDYY